MGWLITAGVLILLAVLPVGVSAIYNTYGPLVRLILGPLKITVFPGKKKKEKPKKIKKKAPAKKQQPSTKAKAKEKKGGSFTDFLPLVDLVLDFV